MKRKLLFLNFIFCIALTSIGYSQLSIPYLDVYHSCNGNCNGGAFISPTGGTQPYTYIWSNSQTDSMAYNLCAGLYSVTVTDNLGASVDTSFTIDNDTISISGFSTPTACSSCTNGTATVTVTQGTGSFVYYWSNGATGSTINGLSTGYYCVTVYNTDSGCNVDTCLYVDSLSCDLNGSMDIVYPGSDTICNGMVTYSASGGTPPYTYLWNTGVTTAIVNNICYGQYIVTICDAIGCCISATADVINEDCHSLFSSSMQTPCTYLFVDNSLGIIDSWLWDFDDGTTDTIQNPTHTFTESGFYLITLTITTADSCVISSSQYISVSGCYPGGTGCITGCTYDDTNDNCIMDQGETKQSSWLVQLFDTNNILVQTTKPYNAGWYNFYNIPAGDYILRVDPVNYWWQWDTECPVPDYYDITVDSSGCDTVHFAVGAPSTSIGQDLSVASDPVGGANPGGTMNFRSGIVNQGSTTMSGSLYFIHDVNFDNLNSSNPTPTSIDGDTLKWDFTNLAPGGIFQPYFSFHISTSVTMGQFLGYKAIANPISGDVTPINNVDTGYVIISAPYDPNNKLVSPMGYAPNGAISDQVEQLTYTINFQNTGNDTAINVYLVDTIGLVTHNLSTLNILNSSHNYITNFVGQNVVIFEFPDIMLPDSNVNEPGSKGYIRYKIDLVENLPEAIVIKNKAAIYFDYNDPVITNWALTTIDKTLVSVPDKPVNEIDMQIWPNPAIHGSEAYIKLSEGNICEKLEIYSTTSKRVLSIPISIDSGDLKISLEGIEKGVYFVKITNTENESQVRKLIVF